jgi:hypothetical protein
MMSDRLWAWVTLLLTGAALALLFLVVPHAVTGDGYARYQKVDALLHEGTLRPEPYSFVGPLFAAPFWAVGGSRLWWVARFNVLLLAMASVAFWLLLRPVTTVNERTSATLLLAATGMAPSATLDFYGEMFSAVMAGSGLLLVCVHDRRAGWIPVVLGVANAPATAVGLLFVAMQRAWHARRIDALAATAVAGGLILLENTIVRGRPLITGYAGNHGVTTAMPFSGMPGFSYPLLPGVMSLLFSFGKGLFFFAPGLLLLAHARRQRPSLAPFLDASVAFLAGLILVYAGWWAWYGGWTWGPRYLLLAAYPSALALAIALGAPLTPHRSALAVALTAWTVWVGASGVVFNLSGLDECLANGYAQEHLCWYVPEYSPLVRPFVLDMPALVTWQQTWLVFAAVVLAVLVTSGPSLEIMTRASIQAIRARVTRTGGIRSRTVNREP